MADARLTDLSALGSAASNDVIYIVDVSDVSENAAGSGRKITVQNFMAGAAGFYSRTRVNGSSFSGGSGSTGRSYQFGFSLTGKELVAVGGAGGRLTPLDPTGGYSLSTTTQTNDTLTIAGELFDDEVIIVWL